MSTHTKRQVCALTPLEESTRGCSDRPLPWSVENQTWTVHTREETRERARGAHATRPLGLAPRSYPGDIDSTLRSLSRTCPSSLYPSASRYLSLRRCSRLQTRHTWRVRQSASREQHIRSARAEPDASPARRRPIRLHTDSLQTGSSRILLGALVQARCGSPRFSDAPADRRAHRSRRVTAARPAACAARTRRRPAAAAPVSVLRWFGPRIGSRSPGAWPRRCSRSLSGPSALADRWSRAAPPLNTSRAGAHHRPTAFGPSTSHVGEPQAAYPLSIPEPEHASGPQTPLSLTIFPRP